MSRKDELLKLAQLFHLQARLTWNRAAKQALRKIGDRYQHEAERLHVQASLDTQLSKEPDLVTNVPPSALARLPKSEAHVYRGSAGIHAHTLRKMRRKPKGLSSSNKTWKAAS
jgi:hypothetical protein